MLTDSGTNAMSDNQLAAMMVADDAYAGSESFFRLAKAVKKIFGFEHTLPVHQGRAAEHLLVKVLLKAPQVVLTNYHFPSTRVHVENVGSQILDLVGDEALIPAGNNPLRGTSIWQSSGRPLKRMALKMSPSSAWRPPPT